MSSIGIAWTHGALNGANFVKKMAENEIEAAIIHAQALISVVISRRPGEENYDGWTEGGGQSRVY